MIDSLTDMSMEGTFTIEEADLKKLQEVLCDIKIEECPWFEVHDKYGSSAKYYREKLPDWIPCSERLPEDGKWCLFTDGVNMSVERYKADAMDHFFPEGRWFSLEDAVAWMPLPEPYREG